MGTQSNFSASDMAWLRADKTHGDYQRGRTDEGIALIKASLPYSETKSNCLWDHISLPHPDLSLFSHIQKQVPELKMLHL